MPSSTLSSLVLNGVFNIEDKGSILSVLISFSCSINLKMDVKSLANESDFLESIEILANLDICIIFLYLWTSVIYVIYIGN